MGMLKHGAVSVPFCMSCLLCVKFHNVNVREQEWRNCTAVVREDDKVSLCCSSTKKK